MSSGGRLHIPFPKTFLSLNTPVKRSGSSVEATAAPEPQQPSHPFLSNRSASGARHHSVSSVSSIDSVASTTPAASNSPPTSPSLKPTFSAFLSLNSKYATPPQTVQEMSNIDAHSFLSNRR